jgi:hypothetical protein
MGKAKSLESEQASWTGDLSSITPADWSYDRAGHRLERAGFGGTPEVIDALAALSPDEAVRHLVYYQETPQAEIPPFRETGFYPPRWSWRDNVRAFAAIQNIQVSGLRSVGIDSLPPAQRAMIMSDVRTGVTPEMKRVAQTDKQAVVEAFFYYTFMDRHESGRLQLWLAERALKTNRPLQEKLALFWHGHFPTGNQKVKDYRKMMGQFEMFHSLGNGYIRDLLIGISKDPAMLVYLDNSQNIKGHPNENFAREFLELFSLGVGNYTETDVKEAARAFTGWGLNVEGTAFENHLNLHDEREKTFLGRKGKFVGEDIVDIVLDEPACSNFLSQKIYSFFVRESISPSLRDKLANLLRGNKFKMAPFLQAIFLSKDFYSPATCGMQVKSPMELVISTYKKLGLKSVPTCPEFSRATASLGQHLFFPSNVKGWDGGKAWISPATMLQRGNIARYIMFPEEMCVRRDAHLEAGRLLYGDSIHSFFMDGAAKNNFTDFPPKSTMQGAEVQVAQGGSEMPNPSTEDYNLFRGVFTATYKSREAIPPEPRKVADFSLSAMLRSEGVTTAGGAVNSLLLRFLRVTVTDEQRDELVNFLEKQMGESRIDYVRYTIERELREVLHLILSTPEYQLA